MSSSVCVEFINAWGTPAVQHAGSERRCCVGATPLPAAWQALLDGRMEIARSVMTTRRCLLLLRRRSMVARRLVSARNRELLEQALLGRSQKELALQHRIAVSTVAAALHDALTMIGLRCRFSHVPLALPLLCHALHGRNTAGVTVHGDVDHPSTAFCILTATRSDALLAPRLSSAEFGVAQAVVAGLSRLQIAEARGTALRTIANQCHQIFLKLHVTGRFELIRYVAERGPASVEAVPLIALGAGWNESEFAISAPAPLPENTNSRGRASEERMPIAL